MGLDDHKISSACGKCLVRAGLAGFILTNMYYSGNSSRVGICLFKAEGLDGQSKIKTVPTSTEHSTSYRKINGRVYPS